MKRKQNSRVSNAALRAFIKLQLEILLLLCFIRIYSRLNFANIKSLIISIIVVQGFIVFVGCFQICMGLRDNLENNLGLRV